MLKTEDVNRELADIVATQEQPLLGDGCYYKATDGSPVCIIGHLLARLEPEFFAQISTSRGGHYNGVPLDRLIAEGSVLVESDDLAQRLDTLQVYQDMGLSWSKALNRVITP